MVDHYKPCRGTGGGNPGVMGVGSLRWAGEEGVGGGIPTGAGDGIPKGAGAGRNKKKNRNTDWAICNIP